MRDRDFFDERDYRYERDYGQHQYNPREGYQSREGYRTPTSREGYYSRYDRNYQQEPYQGQGRYESRYDTGYEPRYEPRYNRPEYVERERLRAGYTSARSYLRCRDIMTRDIATCRRATNLREVARLMRDEDTGAIPVVEDNDRVIGMITDRDIVIRILADKNKTLDACTVEDAMTDEVYAVRPTDRVVDAIRKMGDKQVRRILVTDDHNRLKGIISMSDVATEAELDYELAEVLEEISRPKSWLKRVFS
ncbi:MAG: CBS domain-containing protein [Acidobacteriota bacterium]